MTLKASKESLELVRNAVDARKIVQAAAETNKVRGETKEVVIQGKTYQVQDLELKR